MILLPWYWDFYRAMIKNWSQFLSLHSVSLHVWFLITFKIYSTMILICGCLTHYMPPQLFYWSNTATQTSSSQVNMCGQLTFLFILLRKEQQITSFSIYQLCNQCSSINRGKKTNMACAHVTATHSFVHCLHQLWAWAARLKIWPVFLICTKICR